MNIRFPGQWFQLETGLAYNWHRHYDATTGRYVQPDPLGLSALLSDGPSVYNYAQQASLAWTDSDGLQQTLPPSAKIPGGPWRWVPDAGNSRGGLWVGQPGYQGRNVTASWDYEGHWDCTNLGPDRQRFDRRGNPITDYQAHNPPFPFNSWKSPLGPLPPLIYFDPRSLCGRPGFGGAGLCGGT